MGVIALERVVEDTELAPLAGPPQASLKLAHQSAGAKARQAAPHGQSHVRRTGSRQDRPSAMLDARPRPPRPTGAASRPAATRSPPQIVEGELRRHERTLPHSKKNVKTKKTNSRMNRAMFERPSLPVPP